MKLDRRSMFGAAALPFATGALAEAVAADDWEAIARQYDIQHAVTQLEHGYWGMMARPVFDAYRANLAKVNEATSVYARRSMVPELEAARATAAGALGVGTDELAFTRNATEALKALIMQYNGLKPGDAVLYSDLDYDGMQACMESLASRRGVRVIKFALPVPGSHQALIDAYEQAFNANPDIRMVLLTHVSHRTGLVLPVAEIARLARSRGIDALVDAAHAVGQLDFRLPDLEADFIGMNLHKWVGAPLGVGAIYIRRERIGAIDPDPAENPADSRIEARVHTGTPDFAAQLSVPAAFAFHAAIGAQRREARLKALRDRWVQPLREHSGIEILTPQDSRLYGAITSFRLRGRTSHEDNYALTQRLFDEHRIFTVHRDGLASGSCVRVTPSLATRMEELDRLVDALRALAG